MFDGMMYWQTVQLFTKYNKWRGFWRPEVRGNSCSYWTHCKTFLLYACAVSLIPLFSCFWFGKNVINHTNNTTGTHVLRGCSLYSRHSVSELCIYVHSPAATFIRRFATWFAIPVSNHFWTLLSSVAWKANGFHFQYTTEPFMTSFLVKEKEKKQSIIKL